MAKQKTRAKVAVKETPNSFDKKVERALSERLNASLRKNRPRVENRLRGLIPGWIKSSPEIVSLNSEGLQGSLNAQFGLYPGQAAAATAAIVAGVITSVNVVVRPLSTKLNVRSVVEFTVQPITYENLLSIPEGVVIQETNGKILPWLDWLLNLGNTVIVGGYSYTPENLGRSGGGTMNPGVGWRVPPQYAGVPGDNFISRALANREKEIVPILRDMFNV